MAAVNYGPWGRPPHTLSSIVRDSLLSSIVQLESRGNWKAKNPNSTAAGIAQFITSTWLDVISRHRPDLFDLHDKAAITELKYDPYLALELLARFTEDNIKIIGTRASPGDVYLAHFSGAATALRLMTARQEANADTVFSNGAMQANKEILVGRTIGQVRALFETKMRNASQAKVPGGGNWIDYYAAVFKQNQPEHEPEPIVFEPPVPLPPPAPEEKKVIVPAPPIATVEAGKEPPVPVTKPPEVKEVVQELRQQGSREIKEGDQQTLIGKILAFFGLGSFASSQASIFERLEQYAPSLKYFLSFFESVQFYWWKYWYVAPIIAGIYLWRSGFRIQFFRATNVVKIGE